MCDANTENADKTSLEDSTLDKSNLYNEEDISMNETADKSNLNNEDDVSINETNTTLPSDISIDAEKQNEPKKIIRRSSRNSKEEVFEQY